jgi:hypothetical protein
MDMDLYSSNWELDLEKRKRRRDYEFERDWRIETEAGLAKERKQAAQELEELRNMQQQRGNSLLPHTLTNHVQPLQSHTFRNLNK